MAKQRYINTHFWDDSFVTELDPIEKLLFIYFLTNPLTNIAGAYEISLKRVSFDTGIEQPKIEEILAKFEATNKIIFRDGWILVLNFVKNQSFNPKIIAGVTEIAKCCPDWIKDRLSIAYESLSHLNRDLNRDRDRDVKKKSAPSGAGTAQAKAERSKPKLDFVSTLSTSSAYTGIDVRREFEKAKIWCSKNNRKATERFFVNWLNRIDNVVDTPKAEEKRTVYGMDDKGNPFYTNRDFIAWKNEQWTKEAIEFKQNEHKTEAVH